jgi:predicted nucleic acid-binding protein
MIVVADTSPLSALLTIRMEELLPALFRRVLVPEEVRRELLRTHSNLPTWLEVRKLAGRACFDLLVARLDEGEAAAIALARELKADRLLIDERKGRQVAREEGVAVIGLVGVLILARRSGLVDRVEPLLGRLVSEANMYLDPSLINAALHAVGEA